MNEAKANTKHSDVASSGSKTPVLPAEFVGRIETPFGMQYISRGDSLDCAHMYSKQLKALLASVQGDGCEHFLRLGEDNAQHFMWLALQLAEQTAAMFDIVARDIREGTAMGGGTL